MNLLFVGGFFVPSQMDFINITSKGVVQNAADVLQKNIVKSLSMYADKIEVVNLPFVGAYPALSSSLFFPSVVDEFSGVDVKGLSFLNLPIIKHFSRFFRLTKYLFSLPKSDNLTLVVYSYHLPFMTSAYLLKLFRPNIKTFIVVPDLPEYMSDNNSLIYRFFKKIDTLLGNIIFNKFDGYVFLTRQMAEKLNISADDYIVVEGIADLGDFPVSEDSTVIGDYIFYFLFRIIY